MEKENGGVVVPQEIVASSEEKKKSRRTLRQLQVYRDVSNLKYMVVCTMNGAPRRLAKYFDEILVTVSDAKKCIGMGEATHDVMERCANLDMARVLVEDITDDFVILEKLGTVGNKQLKGVKKMAQGIAAQLIRWRDSEIKRSQGININE